LDGGDLPFATEALGVGDAQKCKRHKGFLLIEGEAHAVE
jgi:hypothetical protein